MFKILFVLICCAKMFAQNNNVYDKIDLSHFGLNIYGNPIAHNSRKYNIKYGNPEERGPYLEGDLLVPGNAKNGIKTESSRWQNGQIPYEIRGSFSA